MTRSVLLCLGFILSTGCSGSIDVGPGGAGSGGSGSGNPQGGGSGSGSGNPQGSSAGTLGAGPLVCEDPTPLPTWPSSTDCAPGGNLPVVGSWHGYIENQQAPWDDLTLVISGASASGGLCGTLKVGGGPGPAPATDANVGYPDPNAFRPSDDERILPGFAFTLLNGSTDGVRVRFSIASTEPWKGWCAMQTSYDPGPGGACNCLPNWGSQGDMDQGCKLLDPAGVQDLSVNCAKLADCGLYRVCQCTGSGCTALLSANFDFDLRFTGDAGEGSSTAALGPRAQFVRMP